MQTFDLVVLWIAALGQAAFVALWATQRWWASTVGRALMAKSAALAVILAASVWSYYRGPIPEPVGRGMFVAVAAAIVVQLAALVWEIHTARRDDTPDIG